MVKKIKSQFDLWGPIVKLAGSVAAIIISLLLIGFTGWVAGASKKAYENCPRITRLEESDKYQNDYIGKDKTRHAVTKYYLEQMAKKMGIDPPPKNYQD